MQGSHPLFPNLTRTRGTLDLQKHFWGCQVIGDPSPFALAGEDSSRPSSERRMGARQARPWCILSDKSSDYKYINGAKFLPLPVTLLLNMIDSTCFEPNNVDTSLSTRRTRSAMACNGCRKLKMKVRTYCTICDLTLTFSTPVRQHK